MPCVFIRDRRGDTDPEKKPFGDGGRDWSDAGQQARNTWSHQKLEKARKDPPPRAF